MSWRGCGYGSGGDASPATSPSSLMATAEPLSDAASSSVRLSRFRFPSSEEAALPCRSAFTPSPPRGCSWLSGVGTGSGGDPSSKISPLSGAGAEVSGSSSGAITSAHARVTATNGAVVPGHVSCA